MDLALATRQPSYIIDAIKATPVDPDYKYHSGTPSGWGHLWEATSETTLALVRSVFPNARQVEVGYVMRSTGWPNTVDSTWQVAILASKQGRPLMNLNIGSGLCPPPAGWLNVDFNGPDADVWKGWRAANPGICQIDIVADCRDLPVDDGTVDRIFFGHMLEHLSYDEGAPQSLREAWRVLRDGGEVGVVGPAMDLAVAMGVDEDLVHAIGDHSGGAGRLPAGDPGLAHLWEADSENTLELVRSVFPNAKITSIVNVSPMTGWPATNAGVAEWQVAVLATKVGS
jgi:SAM-dependent methyltransferase